MGEGREGNTANSISAQHNKQLNAFSHVNWRTISFNAFLHL